jgi:methyl-accepting chemotaxis protein
MLRSIRSKILCATLAIVLISLVVNTALNYWVSRDFVSNSISQNLAALLTAHELGVEEWVRSKTQMIVSLEDACASQDDPTSALRQVAAAGGFTNVYVGLANRTAHFADASGVPKNFDPTGRPWYRQAAEAARPVVLRPYLDMGTGKLVVSFAAPILRNGSLVGVVSGDIAMDSVVSNVTSVRPTPGSFALLLDHTGAIVAFADQRLTQKSATEIFPDLRISALFASAADADGAPIGMRARPSNGLKLVRARAVPGTDWFVAIALDESEATSGLHSLLLASLASLAVLIAVAAAICGYLTTVIFKRLAAVRDAMESIGSGSGDLTQRLPVGQMDEVGQIASSFNTFVGKLNEVMRLIRDTSDSVRHAATEIAGGNHDLSRRTEAAAASLQETAASMEEITSTVTQAANAARQANDKASTASEAASKGGAVVADAVSAMQEIENASGKIRDIIGVIDGIAFQTNILALNAAVEAARAGENGRGFAVVAGEVRTLAQRSAQAAKEIKVLIDSSVVSVSTGVGLVGDAGSTMNAIVGSVNGVRTIMLEISNAADEQTRGIVEVNVAVSQLDSMVQQNAALVEESAAAASTLLSQAVELADAVKRFKIE